MTLIAFAQAGKRDTEKDSKEAKEVAIDVKKLKKMLALMGIGGVIAIAIAAGLSISNPLGAAISSLVKGSATGKLLDLFKKTRRRGLKILDFGFYFRKNRNILFTMGRMLLDTKRSRY